MKVNHKKLYTDIIKKISRLGKSQREISKDLKISRSTLWRISQGKPIQLDSFLRLVDWLENDLNDYITRPERPNYISERLSNINDK